MHEAITIITCLSAIAGEFCSVATFSDMKQCHSESCLPDYKTDKGPHTCDTGRRRRGKLQVKFTLHGNSAYLAARWAVSRKNTFL
jgi:hypothetical protein